MDSKVAALVVVLIACFAGSEASECCKSYTDFTGKYHETKFCEEYCCFDVSLGLFTEGKIKTCCSDSSRRVPESLRDDECISFLKEHIWVPIVSSIVGLIILIGICTCCCCCGCCSCCRKSTPGVVVTTVPGGPSHTVMMSNQSTVVTNPVHAGYNQ